MSEITTLVAQVVARGSAAGFKDTAVEDQLPPDIDRAKARIFTPLQLGNLSLQHRIVHPGLGRARSAFGAESPQAVEYFAQRTTPGSLVISQATGVSAESVAWQWAASLDNDTQQAALSPVIQAVHERGGYWFQQLFHVGRCTTPALVKLARERAGLRDPPPYGYRPVSSSSVPEGGLNTHSGERPGIPHSLTIEEIHSIRDDFKKTAKRAVEAGADGIEILAGNGWLIDQFLHDNINQRADQYGGTVENRSRFGLEILDAIAEVVGYQRIGIRISPFSYFHETNGSQPLEQLLHLCHQAVLRGVAYLHVGQSPSSRNLTVEQNIQRLGSKGISPEDISLRPFRRLLSTVRPTNPLSTQTVLFGNGEYNAVSGILAVEEGLADGVSFGRRFISNPDLVDRLRFGYPLTPNNIATFYTHGAEGYTSYLPHAPEKESSSEQTSGGVFKTTHTSSSFSLTSRSKKRVAIIGAGISGLASATALERVGGFEVRVFERREAPGGSWVHTPKAESEAQHPVVDYESIEQSLPKPTSLLPATVPRTTQQRLLISPLYPKTRVNIPYKILGDGGVFEITPRETGNLFLSGTEISAAIAKKAHQFDHLIEYRTSVEDVEKTSGGHLRLTLRREDPTGTDTWTEEEFDHLIVATGHSAIPRIPRIPGLRQWNRKLLHTVTWRSGQEFRDQKILVVGTGDSAVEVTLQSLEYAKEPVYISQRTPNHQFPTVFSRPGVKVVPTISHLTADTVHLSNGEALADIDTIVLATGYSYNHPFLSSKIRPPPIEGYRIPGLYQHIFDTYNPALIAFNGVIKGSLSWLTWEKSAFLIALLWSGRIHLPPIEAQKAWEARRLEETGDHKFHVLVEDSERVVYFDELNELASEYLFTDAKDDLLLRSFPFRWVLESLKARALLAKSYGISEGVLGNGFV